MIDSDCKKLDPFVLTNAVMNRLDRLLLAGITASVIQFQPAHARLADARMAAPEQRQDRSARVDDWLNPVAALQDQSNPVDVDGRDRIAIDLAQADLRSPGGSALSPPQPGEDEHAFWGRVYAANTREGYELYLRLFPQGQYTDIARAALGIQAPPLATAPGTRPVPGEVGGRNPSPSSAGEMGLTTPPPGLSGASIPAESGWLGSPPSAPGEIPSPGDMGAPPMSRPGGATSGQFPPFTGIDSAKTTGVPIPRRPAEPGTYEAIQATVARIEPSDSADIVDRLNPGTRLNVTGSEGEWLVVYSKTRNRTVYVKRDDAMLISGRDAPRQSRPDPESHWKEVERQIQEAISRRGLTGIVVSFIGDTAYLKGNVRTDRERFTAEQAARSFPEVLHIHNGIWVTP